jgi:hypothetical protein
MSRSSGACLLLVFACSALAQRGGGHAGGGGAARGGAASRGFGNGRPMAGSFARSPSAGAFHGPGAGFGGGRVGGSRVGGGSGFYRGGGDTFHRGGGNTGRGGFTHSRGAYPRRVVYYGGYASSVWPLGLAYWGWPTWWDAPLYDPAPPVTTYYSDPGYAPPPVDQGPPVVIEQNFGGGGEPAYRPPPATALFGPPDFYLIALRDHSIQAALNYWIEDNTLHYITRQHERKTTRFDDLDLEFTQQLNRDRRVEFRLPSPTQPATGGN